MRTPPEYFELAYAGDPEVFGAVEGWYERRKRSVLLASLAKSNYQSAFEPGCGNGALTRELAPRCEHLLSLDGSERALASAKLLVKDFPHVAFSRGTLPDAWPLLRHFDLIVISEVLYYFEDQEVALIAEFCRGSLQPGGELVSVHWRHASPDYPGSGDRAHRILRRTCVELQPLISHEEPDFSLLSLGG